MDRFKSFLRGRTPKEQEEGQPRGLYNPPEGTKNHAIDKMRDYDEKEMDWEYKTEYEKYSKPSFPKAFKDRDHFQSEYIKAPLRHLSHEEIHSLGNSNVSDILKTPGTKAAKTLAVRHLIGTRRNVNKIWKGIHKGKTAPPIILKHSKGLHLMAGNTRFVCGAAHGLNIPAKVIDISDRH
jgi:hypothetical protein